MRPTDQDQQWIFAQTSQWVFQKRLVGFIVCTTLQVENNSFTIAWWWCQQFPSQRHSSMLLLQRSTAAAITQRAGLSINHQTLQSTFHPSHHSVMHGTDSRRNCYTEPAAIFQRIWNYSKTQPAMWCNVHLAYLCRASIKAAADGEVFSTTSKMGE